MPDTTDTLICLTADLLMAEHDLKNFYTIGTAELIKYYELYPILSQTPDMPPSNRHPQTQLPHTSGNQGQYSSTNTPLQSHSGVPSEVPPQQGLRRTLEGQYNTGALVPQSTTNVYSSGMPQQRQNEQNPNNFSVAAQPSSAYNHPHTYPQDPHSNPSMNMYPQAGRDLPSGVPFQSMQNQPIGLNPPSGGSEWNCPHCTFKNSPRNRVCEACAKTPDSIQDQSSAQTMQPQPQQKQCRRCNIMNRMQEAQCEHCGTSFV